MNYIKTTFKLVAISFAFFLYANTAKSQVTLSSEGFENALTYFTVTSGTAAYANGTSASGDRPASTPFYTAGSYGLKVNNTTTVLTSDIISTQNFTNASLSFRLAAFAIGSSSAGLDGTDYVKVEISTDGGTTFTTYLTVNGNSNAYWSFSSGTGTATTTFANPNQTFAPTAGSSRTTDGYSTVSVTALPQSSNLVVRISLSNNNTNEQWVIDDCKLVGTSSCTYASTGISALNISNPTNDGFDASWTNGNSNKRLISVHATSNLQSIPVSGTSYIANTAWVSAGQINSNNRVVYTGSSSVVNGISGLNPQTNYTVQGFEYTNSTTCYVSLNWANATFYTLSNPATAHATSFTGTSVSGSQINLSWTAATWPASGATSNGYVILYRTDGTNPTATGIVNGGTSSGFSLPSGTSLLTTINSGATTSFSHTGLSLAQNVRYLLVPFTWDGANAATINYLTSATIPTCSATTMSSFIPSISSANLSNVYVGSSVVLTGTNFVGLTGVTVGGVSASYTVQSASQITVTIPAAITSGNIVVTNSSGTATYNSLSFLGYISNSSTSYTSGAAWLGGSQPPVGSDITIAHNLTAGSTINTPKNVTIQSGGSITTTSGSSASNSGSLTINAGGTFTLGPSNATWTSNGNVINNGTINFNAASNSTLVIANSTFQNNGTVTMGLGTITASGTSTISASNLSINNLSVSGATTIPAGLVVNGTLTIQSGGSLLGNSPTYGSTATLVYGKSSSGTGLEWVIGATTGTAGCPENVTIQSGSTLTLNGNGTYVMDGNLSNAGTLTLGGTSTLQVNGNFTGAGTFNHGNRKVILGGTTQSMSISPTFYDLDISSTNLNISGSPIISNKLNILAGSTVTSSSTLTISSTAATPSNLYGTLVNTNTLTISNTGGLVLQAGSNYVHNNTNSSATILSNTIRNTGSTFTFRGSSTVATSVAVSNRTFANLSFESASGTWTTNIAGGSPWTVNGDLTIGTGVALTATSAYTGTITWKGKLVVDGSLPTTNPFNVSLTGTNDTISGSGTIRFGTLTLSGVYQSLSPLNITTLSIPANGSLSIQSSITSGATTVNGTMLCNGSIVSGTTFTLGATGTLGIGHNQGIESTGNQGNIQTSGTRTFPSTASYIYNGTSSQVSGAGLPASVANLTVNNTGTGANNMVTLAQTTTVTNTLNLVDGHFAATGAVELVVSNTATNAITGYASMALANNSSYVEGNLRRKITTGAYDYPLGTSQNYQLATITVNSNTNVNNILVHFDKFASGCGYNGNTPSFYAKPTNGSQSTLVDDMLNFGYYTVEPYDASNALVTTPNISYDAQMLFNGHTNGVSGYATVNSNYTLMKKPACGGAWGLYGGNFSTAVNQAQNSNSGAVALKLQGLVSFSQFGAGFSSGTVLPLEMTNFTGEQVKEGNQLSWTTLSEEATIKFVIERSENADDFTAIGEVGAKGARNTGADYNFVDAKAGTGLHYYRLKAVDVDGNVSYSEMIALGTKGAISNFNVYPNPAANEIHFAYQLLQANTQATLKVYSMTGALMHAETLNATETNYTLDTHEFKNGLYLYEVLSEGRVMMTGKFDIAR